MADLSWPAELPQAPLLASYSVKADSGIIRTPMDSGLARQRKRFSTPTSRVPVAWHMNGPQVALFKSWLVHRAANGGAWFNINMRLDDGDREVEARFVADATYKLIGRGWMSGVEKWMVSAELEIKDGPPLSSEVLDIVLGIGADELYAIDGALVGPFLAPAFATWHSHFGA